MRATTNFGDFLIGLRSRIALSWAWLARGLASDQAWQASPSVPGAYALLAGGDHWDDRSPRQP